MIELTVRTLDSQNHQFTVEEDITVAQFKEKIASTVNIPAETQRIIYCGRVLNDEAKLNEFDVNGKVVHLVERAPPSETQRSNNVSTASAQSPMGRGNAMYIGSMQIPVEPFDIVSPPPSQSLAASRLNVARRMLRRVEAILNILENPTARPADVVPPEEPQEEVTPVFEARVIVPRGDSAPLEETLLEAVQENLAQTSGRPTGSEEGAQAVTASSDAAADAMQSSSPEISPQGSTGSSTPDTTPISSSTEDLAAEVNREPQSSTTNNTTNANTTNTAERASRPSDMVELLDRLTRLQTRFAPFLERYQNFMREDAVVEQPNIRPTQLLITRVSEVFHLLGHAYHSLSDILLMVRNPPPRSLSCIPILIQHSAVLQAGFPIQVEAQINFGPENANENSSTPTSTTNGNATTANGNANVNGQATTTTPPSSGGGNARPNISINPNILSFQTIPIGIRTMRSASGGTNRQTGNAPAANASNAASSNNGSNPNVELFMEVTPDSITIDSLATTLLGGSNQGGEAGRANLAGAPPPELFQTFVQMANQFVNRGTNVANTAPASTQQSQTTSPQTPESALNQSGQNSQARGNTQTNPTTSTHTRSTPRPHVHLSQHAMQGFDPFLPCSSHHISHRRRAHLRNQSNNNNARAQTNGNTNNNFGRVYNIVQGVLSSLQNMYDRRASTGSNGTPPTTSASTATPNQPNFHQIFTNLSSASTTLPTNGDGSRGPTLADLLSAEFVHGEGIFNDLLMFLSQNLTIGDLVTLNSGRVEPFIRVRNELRTFVLDRILEGSPTPDNLERGVNKLLEEMQPFFDHLSQLPVQGDIDLVRSVKFLIGSKLRNIIMLAVSRSSTSVKSLYLKIQMLMHHICALILHASSNGQRGVEDLLMSILSRYMEGYIPQDVEQWTILAVRTQLQQFITNLRVPTSSLQQYIIRNVDSITATNVEQMETEEHVDQASSSSAVQINLGDSQNELPAVDVGSESWHGQVPNDWVPIISRDSQGQRRQNPQTPLSDAYLSGMPSKRRKIVTSPKPQGSLPQVIAESIRRAVVSTGLSTINNVEEVAQEAGDDLNIQSAYRELLRTRVQSNIQDNEDFTPDRFPNASNYFNKQQ